MEIKSRIEEEQFGQNSVEKKVFYLDVSPNEFYSVDEYNMNDFAKLKFSEITRKAIEINEQVAVVISKKFDLILINKKRFWHEFKRKNNIIGRECIEFEKNNTFSSLFFVEENELNNFFHVGNWMIVIGTNEVIKKIYLSNPLNYKFLRNEFLNNNCKVIEFNDLGIDGKILNVYQKNV